MIINTSVIFQQPPKKNFQVLGIIGGLYIANSRCYRNINIKVMGKKQRKQQNYTTASTFKIHKNKSLSANLTDYIRVLKSKYSHLSTKQYLNLIHKYIQKYKQMKGTLPQSLVVQTTAKIKICKKCDKWAIGTRKMIECILCEDYYHYECVGKYNGESQWACLKCSVILEKWEKQNEIEKKKQKIYSCSKCNKNINQLSIKCLKCFNFFHKSCYGGFHVVCNECGEQIKNKVQQKQRQLTLGQSFHRAELESSKKKIKKSERTSEQTKKQLPSIKSSLVLFGKDINKSKGAQQGKKADEQCQINESTTASSMISTMKRFKFPFPKMTPQQIEMYRQKLLFAIFSKNMQYTQDLFCNGCKLEEDNEDSVDFALTHLSMSDYKMFKQYKKQPIGPFLLDFKEKCGYDVIADKNLPKGMIVCEYVGDVYTTRDRIHLSQQNDSVMQLKKGKNADESLLIVPRKYTNIARFINGVNESDAKKGEKQNVESVRYLVNGRPAVILFTIKNIKKGESLLYNYGAGLTSKKYDTSYYE